MRLQLFLSVQLRLVGYVNLAGGKTVQKAAYHIKDDWFCGFRYDPQMNADERRQTLTACAAGSISVHLRFAGITAV